MGLTLQFAIGDKQTIIDAAKRFDFEFLDQLEDENKLADFSLHLVPDDLNFLVHAAAELNNIAVLGLRSFLDTTNYYFDSSEGGAYFVDPVISEIFSKLNESNALQITQQWFKKMTAEYKEDTAVNDDAIAAVTKLISISKAAKDQQLDLVHTWFL